MEIANDVANEKFWEIVLARIFICTRIDNERFWLDWRAAFLEY